MLRKLTHWLCKKTGVGQEWLNAGYEWGWRAARAHPDVKESRIECAAK